VTGPRFVRTLDDDVARIAVAVVEHGALDRDELAERVGARHWSAGRFAEALRVAEDDGHVRRIEHDRFASPVARYR
jgi:hypothetical protein